MVDVKPKNGKLLNRAKNIVMKLTDVGEAEAKKYLKDSGNDVKVAYRPVHAKTLTNDVQYFPPKERVY